MTQPERFHHTEGSASRFPGRLATLPGWQPLRYVLDPEGFFAAAQRRHGDIFTMRMLAQRWIVLANAADIAKLFSRPADALDTGQASHSFRPLIGTSNMLMLDGEDYLRRRRLVLPVFHGQHTTSQQAMIRSLAAEHIKSWPRAEPTAIYQRLSALVLAIIVRCVFGIQEEQHPLTAALQQMRPWITDTRRVLTFFLLGPERLTRLPRYRRMIAVVDHHTLAAINQRRNSPDLDQRQDALSLLLGARDADGRGLSDRELRDELVTLLFAGHENTTALLAWASHELARAPEHQERVARDDTFADAVLNETLRLRPPVPLLVRRLRTPLTLGGHHLPTGSNVCPCTLLTHRDPRLYTDPWAFDPQRFLTNKPPAHEWFPYGAGIRRCIGASFAQLEARTILQEITRTVRLTPTDPQPEPPKTRAIVLIPRHGTRLKLSTRTTQ